MDSAAYSTLWASFVTITAVWLAALVAPGPDFLATVHTALSGSRRSGVLVAAGIAAGMAAWATASLLGLGLLFRSAEWLYSTVKLAGAAYLVYLGIRMLWSARAPRVAIEPVRPAVSHFRAFRRGFLTNLSNPKAAALFGSLFAVLAPAAAPAWFDAAIVVMMVVTAGGWYVAVACAMTSGPVALLYRRAERAISAVTGALFVGLGARMAADR